MLVITELIVGGGSKRIVLVHYFHLCGFYADCEGWESFHIARFWVLNRNTSKNENIFRQQGQNKLAEMFLHQKSTVTPFDKHFYCYLFCNMCFALYHTCCRELFLINFGRFCSRWFLQIFQKVFWKNLLKTFNAI